MVKLNFEGDHKGNAKQPKQMLVGDYLQTILAGLQEFKEPRKESKKLCCKKPSKDSIGSCPTE